MKRWFSLGPLAVYALFAANAAIIAWFWWHGSGAEAAASQHGFITAIGRLAGLLGAYCILWQIVLIGRSPLVERTLGLERQLQLHRWNGYAGYWLILLHPILLTVGYAETVKIGLWSQFWQFLTSYEHVWLAFLALLMFTGIVAASVVIVRRRLRYETWYFIHLTTYLAILLAFFHQLNVGTDFIGQPWATNYWYGLYIVAFGLLLIWRFGLPAWQYWRYRFVVDRVVPESTGVASIYITGRNIEKFHYQPGQFIIWRFLSQDLWWQAHPFSISSSPGDGHLRITVKALGDFTAALQHIVPGTAVLTDGPHGSFTPALHHGGPILLVAGGIGITPLRSMLATLSNQSDDIVLVYAVRTRKDLALYQELETFVKAGKLRVELVMSQDDGLKGYRGYINKDMLAKAVPDVASREAFVCGPPPMVELVRGALGESGVPAGHIYCERFAYVAS